MADANYTEFVIDTLPPPANKAVRERITSIEAERDRAYRERAHLVAHLASLYPSHIGYTDPESPDWAVIIVQSPAGQLSWHIAPGDMELFEHVPRSFPGAPGWDGHTTGQKYERLRRLTERRRRGAPIQGTGYTVAERFGTDSP